MPRWAGTTTQRGLGHAHQADKKRLLAALRPGDPCLQQFLDGTICGQPMFPWQELDRGHVIDRALGGANGPAILVHASCNRRAGAQLGNAMQAAGLRRPGLPQRIKPCSVCGKITDRAARLCEICGAHCHPSHSFVRTCGRKCGVELRRRLYGHAGTRAPQQRTPCELCGNLCSAYTRFCSKTCADQAARRSWPASKITYYTCRYCGQLRTAKSTGQPREVCPDPLCQSDRLAENRERHDGRPRRRRASAAATALTDAEWTALVADVKVATRRAKERWQGASRDW